MKRTQQILATIISLIILNFFAGTAQAQVCTGNYFIDSTVPTKKVRIIRVVIVARMYIG
jgi:hypothetical protein